LLPLQKTAVCIALFLVILNAKRERIRLPLKKKRIAAHHSALAMTKRYVILSDVASACGAGKSEQKEAPRSKVVRAPSENNFWAPQEW